MKKKNHFGDPDKQYTEMGFKELYYETVNWFK
jgi:hypothetical protein